MIETIIVIFILAVLATTIVPQYTGATADANYTSTMFNLQGMRLQIERYRNQQQGAAPQDLQQLTIPTDSDAHPGGDRGLYRVSLPTEEITPSRAVVLCEDDPIIVTGTRGGWICHGETGELRINHSSHSGL